MMSQRVKEREVLVLVGYKTKRRKLTGYTRETCCDFLIKHCPEKYRQVYGEEIKGIFNRVNCEIWLDTFMEYMESIVNDLEEDTRIIFEGLELWRTRPIKLHHVHVQTGEAITSYSKHNYKLKFRDSFWAPKNSWRKYIKQQNYLKNIISRQKYKDLEEQIGDEAIDDIDMNL